MIDGFTYSDDVATNKVALDVLRKLRPHRVKGVRKIRIGNDSDGGYVMLDDFSNYRAAYSLGINTDVTWDLAIAEKGIHIYQYDHTIEALPVEHELFHWKKIGIGAESVDPPLAPLDELMRQNGHGADGGDLLLKCDIEGHEWQMLQTLPDSSLNQFRQIVMECHGFSHLDKDYFAPTVAAGVQALTRNHRVVHIHGNNNSAYAIVGGVAVPATMEITLVRTDSYDLQLSDETFPTELDRPCFPHRADYALGRFDF